MFQLTLTLHSVQLAARKRTQTEIEDASQATQWLAAQWEHKHPEHTANFLIGPLTGGRINTIKAFTGDTTQDKSRLENFARQIEEDAYIKDDKAPGTPLPFTMSITLDEDLIRKAVTGALRAAFSSSERYESGEGTKTIVAQVNKFARETDFRPLIEELAPAIIKAAVAETLEAAVKTALRDELKRMKGNGELATLFDQAIPSAAIPTAEKFTIAESRNGADTSMGYATIAHFDTIGQALTWKPLPHRMILHPNGTTLYASDETGKKWIEQ